jgi:hypothetical protein
MNQNNQFTGHLLEDVEEKDQNRVVTGNEELEWWTVTEYENRDQDEGEEEGGGGENA